MGQRYSSPAGRAARPPNAIGAIHSPKFVNLLKFYPCTKRPCNIFLTFFPQCRFCPCCKFLQWVRAESGYQIQLGLVVFLKPNLWCYKISQRIHRRAWLNRQKSRWEDRSVSEASHAESRGLVVVTRDPNEFRSRCSK